MKNLVLISQKYTCKGCGIEVKAETLADIKRNKKLCDSCLSQSNADGLRYKKPNYKRDLKSAKVA